MELLNVSMISVQGEFAPVLNSINFTQKPGEQIAIAGETGSGKSTLLKIIAGLHQADSGTVVFQGETVKGPMEKLVPGHKEISYLSQHFDLAHSLRVEQVLQYASNLSVDAAAEVYDICHVSHLMKRKTSELSGGERQRIAIAQVLVGAPKLILLDEPYSNLDTVHKNILKSVIHQIGDVLKISCILVSHDPQDTLSWADKILVLRNGGVVQFGTPEEIYQNPVDEYVAGLFGDYNLFGIDASRDLCELYKIPFHGGKLFLRPEDLQIVNEGSRTIPAKVKAVRYYGSYFLIEMSYRKRSFTARSQKGNFKKGQEVCVKVQRQQWRFLR
jgi:ABC-type sulfate/molybdate transport systems ATPase subunit